MREGGGCADNELFSDTMNLTMDYPKRLARPKLNTWDTSSLEAEAGRSQFEISLATVGG